MQKNELQDLQDKLKNEGLPFAFWSLPGSLEWEGIAQKNRKIDQFDPINSDGFIIKGFNDEENIKFIRSDLNFNKENLNFNIDLEPSSKFSIRELPKEISKGDYLKQCKEIIDRIKGEAAEKVVLSRVKRKNINDESAKYFLDLIKAYPNAMVFMYFLKDFLWIGASPETLLNVKGDKFETMALAGSRRVGEANEWMKKEVEEQAYVTNYIDDLLKKHVSDYTSQGPETINAGPLEHLCTRFSGHLDEAKFLDLLNDLHPTPAVCGIPVESAKEMINNVEGYDRMDYTGFIGPVNKNKKHLFVNLRSAIIEKDVLCLFLGGGITKDSIPMDEWSETELKAETLLRIL